MISSTYTLPNQKVSQLIKWLPVIIGLFALYVPTVYGLANGLWNSEDQAHGPIVLVVVLYLFWQHRLAFNELTFATNPRLGISLLVIGLLMYAIGRSQEIYIFEIGSMVPVFTGTTLITLGMQGFRKVWFAIFFTIFMIPLPGVIVDTVTGPLKQHLSLLAESFLYALDYPIGRSGVTITIGTYQLLVADACSGLHSMFSLTALGLLYLYLMQYQNKLRSGLLIVSILPIAFVANLIRIIALILITYYFGDEVGQGFVHKFAGMFLFVISLLCLFVFDALLGRFSIFRDKKALTKGHNNER